MPAAKTPPVVEKSDIGYNLLRMQVKSCRLVAHLLFTELSRKILHKTPILQGFSRLWITCLGLSCRKVTE